MAPVRLDTLLDGLDLDLMAQRLLRLAEIATLEHLEVLMNSQAHEMLKLASESDA
jgi:hypothetical protein